MYITTDRVILTFVVQAILSLVFGYIAQSILRRKKNQLNKYFALFFIFLTVGNVINIIYVLIFAYSGLGDIVVILHLITNFFNFFGLGFLYVVNQIILKSAMVFSKKDIMRYLIGYGVILIVGSIIIQLFDGVSMSSSGYPVWSIYYFIFILSITIIIALIPIIISSFRIYQQLEGKEIKRRYLSFFAGILGLIPLLITIFISNYLNIANMRTIVSFVSVSMILWVLLIYYGLRRRTK
ncbi:MAG: hypothetical protein GF311_03940 [Candidatus Lokiarchaeota archaeon]|nr:hypothetical protein [Candidatus Lokiarchaeota archaeon]